MGVAVFVGVAAEAGTSTAAATRPRGLAELVSCGAVGSGATARSGGRTVTVAAGRAGALFGRYPDAGQVRLGQPDEGGYHAHNERARRHIEATGAATPVAGVCRNKGMRGSCALCPASEFVVHSVRLWPV